MASILRDKNKFIGCKKITVVYPEGCYRHYFFKHDIKYCVVLKNCERFFVLFSIILRYWIIVFLWFFLPGAKVDKVQWFLKLFFYFIKFMLWQCFLWQSENIYELRHQILSVESNYFGDIKINQGTHKKIVIPNISVSFDYFFHDNL